MSAILVRQPNDGEFEELKKYTEEFRLDNENMSKEQFKVLLHDGKLAAFGRLKKHQDSLELCTVGVVEEFRAKKLGGTIVKQFLSDINQDLYLVTVIPDFFNKLGFKETKEYPQSIREKTDRCGTKYHVDESYVVMKYIALPSL